MSETSAMLLNSLDILFERGDVIELRALGKRKNDVQSGYFKDFKKLAEVARILDVAGEHKGIYTVINKVNPALYARSPDKLTPARAQPTTTSDQDILQRVWLPIDFDPIRPADISSTEEEHNAAINRAKKVRETLRDMGWPDPILADSGNGAHLLYRIDLPNDEDNKILIDHVLKAFDCLFSDERVAIDQKVFNAARIWKMYGTAARKGDNIEERPWRVSRLLEVPSEIAVVDRKLLELEAWAWEQKNQAERFEAAKSAVKREIDLGQWLQAHGLDVAKTKGSTGGGTIYILDRCPWDSSHADHSAFAIQYPSGAIVAGCHHNSCSGKGWKDLKKIYEPVVDKPDSPVKAIIRDPIANITLVDVADIDYDDEGRIDKIKFSPNRAADAICQYLNVISTPDERIWVYSEGVYTPGGDSIIDKILDEVAGDNYTIRASKETQRKIVLRTMEDYSCFNSNPLLFAVNNGVLDMQTGKFMPHSPDYRLTLKSPVKYDPDARCPEISKFFTESLGSDDNILSVLDIFTAKTTTYNFEYFVAAIGEGSNGKTILEELIRNFFGDDQIAEVEIATLDKNRFDKIQLQGKRFLINSEVAGDLKESRIIKAISGGMRMDADQKNKDHILFRPHCLIFIDTNNPPRFADNTHGFQRRLVKIDFPFKFVDEPVSPNEKVRIPDLINKITTDSELSGLLNVLIANAGRVLPQKKIHRRASGKELAEEYDLQANSIAAFYDMFCESVDLDKWVSSGHLYKGYSDFCKKINATPSRDREFFSYARKHFNAVKSRETTPAGKIRVLRGLDLDDDKLLSFTNRTIYGPSTDQLNQQQDQQDQLDRDKTILELLKENIFCKRNSCDLAGLAGPAGPDSDFDGPCAGPLNRLAGPQVDSVLKRCIAVLQKKKSVVTPFILSTTAETLDASIPPSQCAAWLKEQGWAEGTPGWTYNHDHQTN